MLEMSKRCQRSKSPCQLKCCMSSVVDTQCKTSTFVEDALGPFPDEPILSALDKFLYGVGAGNLFSSNCCPPKDCLPACCAPKPTCCTDSCDADAFTAVKSCKGSTTSIISLKSCTSGGSSASRMRYTSPCGKHEEHFILQSDFKKSNLRNICHKKTGAIERVIAWAKGLPCPKSSNRETCNSNRETCKQNKPLCCKRISCKASSCADAKINIYDDGSKTVEIVERRPPHCLKKPRTILFIGILKDGTAVSFDVPENC